MRPLLLPALMLPAMLHGQALPQVTARPLICGEVLQLQSSFLGQARSLNLQLPEGYGDSTLTYPVIYVLDGSKNEDFPHIAGLVQFLNMYDLLPKSIVVGIANTGRSRYHDFTPPTQSDSDKVWVPECGGAEAFMDFLEHEVQPLIKQYYRTNGRSTLLGQSLGGLLGMAVLHDRPDLFDDYVLVSPSLWWNSGSLADSMAAWVRAHDRMPKRVYMAAAPDDAMMRPQIDEVARAFQQLAHAPLQFRFEPFPEESHLTILHRAAYKAFEWLGKKSGN